MPAILASKTRGPSRARRKLFIWLNWAAWGSRRFDSQKKISAVADTPIIVSAYTGPRRAQTRRTVRRTITTDTHFANFAKPTPLETSPNEPSYKCARHAEGPFCPTSRRELIEVAASL